MLLTITEEKMSEKYLTSIEAAKHLGYSANTLKLSRHTGTLAGTQAPSFIKFGKSVRYEITTLNSWLSQFKSYKNTSEYEAI